MGDIVSGITGAIGIGKSLFGGGGSSGAGQAAQGAANIAGGMLSANEAQQIANQLGQTANPFGQYNQQFGAQLAGAANIGAYGNQNYNGQYLRAGVNNGTYGQSTTPGQTQQSLYTNQSTLPLTGALNGQDYGQQINNLIANPSSVFDTAQYKAAFGQGQNAVNATLAAQGLNASGNQLAALQNYGQSFGQQAYANQLSQLSGLYGQALGANQQGYQQLAGNTQQMQSSNQQGFNQLLGLENFGLASNENSFNQLALMSGLSSGSPAAAAQAQSNVWGNVNSAYQGVGQGIGQLAGGVGNILNGLSTGSTFAGQFGQGTDTSGNIAGSGALFGASAGMGDSSWNYGGGNEWGF